MMDAAVYIGEFDVTLYIEGDHFAFNNFYELHELGATLMLAATIKRREMEEGAKQPRTATREIKPEMLAALLDATKEGDAENPTDAISPGE